MPGIMVKVIATSLGVIARNYTMAIVVRVKSGGGRTEETVTAILSQITMTIVRTKKEKGKSMNGTIFLLWIQIKTVSSCLKKPWPLQT